MFAATSLLLTMGATTWAAPVKITNTSAKSEYDMAGDRYPASKVKDGQVATQWFEGDRGNGLGAWLQVEFGSEVTVTKVVMYAGDWKSKTKWERANRPKELEVKYSDESTETWTLTDEWAPQVFVPAKPTATSSIRFKINGIYNGTAFPDTAISEIVVYDDKPDMKVSSWEASSEFPPDADGMYDASQMVDGMKDTFWCENDKEGDGVGEWVKLNFPGSRRISQISVCSGMCIPFNLAVHKKGNVPTQLSLEFSDGSRERLTLKDAPMAKSFPITPRSVDWVKVTVDAVRKGSEYNDACISEVAFK